MIEPQLIDYIKKAKSAGQSEEKTKALLLQNGWTDQEIAQAFLAISDSAMPKQSQATPDAKPNHQVSGQPAVNITAQAQPQAKAQPSFKPHVQRPGARLTVVKVIAVVILLAIIGGGLYFALAQGDFMQKIVDKTISYFSPKVNVDFASDNTEQQDTNNQTPPESTLPTTKELAVITEDYNALKTSLIAFSEDGSKTVFCAPSKATGAISCFLNNQKFFDNPYSKKPYWMGVSPDGQRVVFLYYETAKKESFVFENGVEVSRHSGAITSPVFSKDSQSFMFVVLANSGKSYVHLGEKSFPEHDDIITTPKWSDDGKYIFYGAKDGNSILWVADKILD